MNSVNNIIHVNCNSVKDDMFWHVRKVSGFILKSSLHGKENNGAGEMCFSVKGHHA